MKMKKIIAAALVLSLSLALAACSSDENAEETVAQDTTAVAVETVVETEATETTEPPFPTGIPLDQDAYVEFDEPVMYEVIEDCDSWTDNGVQFYARTYVAGSVVNAVATDGYYLILDDQTVIEASHLQVME